MDVFTAANGKSLGRNWKRPRMRSKGRNEGGCSLVTSVQVSIAGAKRGVISSKYPYQMDMNKLERE
jgi:hypothetical protein